MLMGDAVCEHALLELEHAPRSVDDGLIEGLAEWALSEGPALKDVARLLKVEIRTQSLPAGVYGMRVAFPEGVGGPELRGYVLVAPLKASAMRRLVIAHELCHGVLRGAKLSHSHVDVWAVTLALLMPRAALLAMGCPNVTEMAAVFGVPWWAAWARLKMSRVSAEISAA